MFTGSFFYRTHKLSPKFCQLTTVYTLLGNRNLLPRTTSSSLITRTHLSGGHLIASLLFADAVGFITQCPPGRGSLQPSMMWLGLGAGKKIVSPMCCNFEFLNTSSAVATKWFNPVSLVFKTGCLIDSSSEPEFSFDYIR